MKRTRGSLSWSILVILSLMMVSACWGQIGTNEPPGPAGGLREVLLAHRSEWRATAREWNRTEWEATETVTNAVAGVMEEQVRRYVEIGNGLNYLDDTGAWQASAAAIEILTNSGGAAALRGPTKVYFPATLGGRDQVITFVTASNTVLRIAPLAVYYTDAESGRSVLLGAVHEVEGELVPPNQVVYRGIIAGWAEM